MPVTDLLLEGLRLMVIGMGIVFAFLLLLVGVLRLMSGAVLRFAPESPALSGSAAAIAHGRPADAVDDPELIAVISAAIARYRSDRRNA